MRVPLFIRDTIRTLTPYQSFREGYANSETVFLDSNENPFTSESQLNRYPSSSHIRIKEEIGRIKNVSTDAIVLGNGSDELIELLIKISCEPTQDNILTFVPTFGMYKLCAQILGVGVIEVALNKAFTLDASQILNACTADTKLIFLCSPNNPTGNLFSKEEIRQVLSCFKGLVVIDEAYIDFSPKASFLNELPAFKNLVILQTFSKAWALAGLRIGMAFANPVITRYLNAVKFPYNLNSLSQEVLLNCLKNNSLKNKNIERIVSERHRLFPKLKELRCIKKVYPSEANFFLINTERGVFKKLLEQNILVRKLKMDTEKEWLRVTIGTAKENQILLNRLIDISRDL